MQRRATALALVLVFAGIAGGVTGVTVTAQDDDDQGQDNDAQGQETSSSSSSDCSSDYDIAESHDDAGSRTLLGGFEEVGLADVDAGTPEDLRVHLETSDDQLDIEVFHIDGDTCQEFNESNCDVSVTQTSHQTVCTLDDPMSGTKDYWVHFTNPESDELIYHAWTPEA